MHDHVHGVTDLDVGITEQILAQPQTLAVAPLLDFRDHRSHLQRISAVYPLESGYPQLQDDGGCNADPHFYAPHNTNSALPHRLFHAFEQLPRPCATPAAPHGDNPSPCTFPALFAPYVPGDHPAPPPDQPLYCASPGGSGSAPL